MTIKLKSEAFQIFGSQAKLARALEVSDAAIHAWPEQLTLRQSDQVLGAAIRLGLIDLKKVPRTDFEIVIINPKKKRASR